MGKENLASTRIRSPDRPARSESLYRLRYPGRPSNRSMNVSRKGTRQTGLEGSTLWVFRHTGLGVRSRSVICVESLSCVLLRHSSAVRFALTLRLLMSYIYIYIYIYGAPILDVSRSHTRRRTTVGRTPLDE